MREKIVILLPLTFNDGTRIPEQMLDDIYQELFFLCGGYRVAGIGSGAYRMADGTKQVEETQEIWAALPTQDVPALKNLVAKWCSQLQQECIWFERSGSVDFVGPEQTGDPHE